MINKPDYNRAAMKAMEMLIENNITETPVYCLPLLVNYPHVRVMSFSNMADTSEIDREDLVPQFRDNQDAATFRMNGMKDVEYVVVYNMRLPYEEIRRSIARELGHIVLGHDGETRPKEVRMAEAKCFAHHLLTPRPIIHMLQESGMPLTMNALVHTTGCSSDCVDEIQEIPGVSVPAELNRKVRKLFEPHIMEYIRFHKSSPRKDTSPVADFGTFMDGYEE